MRSRELRSKARRTCFLTTPFRFHFYIDSRNYRRLDRPSDLQVGVCISAPHGRQGSDIEDQGLSRRRGLV
jgi:hypothetical protein